MVLKKEKVVKAETKLEDVTFTKVQIISSKKYKENKDLLNVVLKESRLYSFNEVDILIEKFMKGKVK